MGQAIATQQQSFIGSLARSRLYSKSNKRGNRAKRLVETKQMSRE